MRSRTKWDENISKHKQGFMEKGFELFSSKSIEAVRLEDVAKVSERSLPTLYRYFGSKPHFLVEIARWKWDEFFTENRKRRPSEGFDGKTAADMLEFYLDSYLEVYRNHKELLRFNQLFNVYLRSEEIDMDHKAVYMSLMKPIKVFVHAMYERGKQDGTLRTDISEAQMLSVTMHLMLAVVTRYAIGLVHELEEGFNDIQELETLKRMLYREYTIQ